jgi:hypothetical protein
VIFVSLLNVGSYSSTVALPAVSMTRVTLPAPSYCALATRPSASVIATTWPRLSSE